ncbi:helicase HerA-like domain-containing protein [Kineococcus rubinsiae]|uniref:helicase HerA-like domain-containing protein n=1 Tax=Kineococcus rubinsiae TaxID=2609562 RepID=UPI0027E4179A|nr:helicase HerA-like domain-containing protein [Kineococcus rubinsiae]
MDEATQDAWTGTVRAGYAGTGPAIELGALLTGDPGSPTAVPDAAVRLPLSTLNRHGLVAGATGTGKTKTLQLMAEQLSAQGVPVFLADVKGDLSGIAVAGADSPRVRERAATVGQEWAPFAAPVELLALGGRGTGVPVRASVTSFGPLLLAKVLGLNDVQTSSLQLIFHWADTRGLALLDLPDLRAVVTHLTSDEGRAELRELGGLSRSTAGVVLRELVAFSAGGADAFFGEPELDTHDLLRVAPDGRGVVSCLELAGVVQQPRVFSAFLMWLLADLFADLPEVGDVEKPKLVFFFDEAHLLFADASDDFLEQVTQTVRLIRSKGVGVFFVTQVPADVHPAVLAQLGNRVQHALRAYTPGDAKALRAAASTFPRSPYDLEELLTGLGTGEAVVTVLSERGAPTPVAWTRLRAPGSLMAPAPAATADALVTASPLQARYGTAVDRESARELLAAEVTGAPTPATPAPATPAPERPAPETRRRAPDPERHRRAPDPEPSVVESVVRSSAFRSFLRSAASAVGREIVRGAMGTSTKRRR